VFSASSETRDRNAPTNANQIRLQTSRIRQEHRPIRWRLPARLSFRQRQDTKPLLLGRNFEEGIHGEAADFVVEKASAEPYIARPSRQATYLFDSETKLRRFRHLRECPQPLSSASPQSWNGIRNW